MNTELKLQRAKAQAESENNIHEDLRTIIITILSNPIFTVLLSLGAIQWMDNHYYYVDRDHPDKVVKWS